MRQKHTGFLNTKKDEESMKTVLTNGSNELEKFHENGKTS
jgi:hypothetical protein